MSATIAELELSANDFALSQTISELDDVEFDVERFVATDPEYVMPYVWITGSDGGRIEEILAEDPSIEDVQLLSEFDDEWLYRMRWIDQIDTLIQILVEEEGTILTAYGNEAGWRLRVLFPERAALSRTFSYCRDHGFSMDMHSVYELDEGRQGRFGLTDSQRETLETAFQRGYFDVPRAISLTDLAEELDISHQALSERLRRGEKRVLENTVIIGRDDERN